jgi:hypothetical protein
MHTSGEFIELKGYGHGKDLTKEQVRQQLTPLNIAYFILSLLPKADIDDTDTTQSKPTTKMVSNHKPTK